MTGTRRRVWLLVVMALLAGAGACSSGPVEGQARGIVVGVDADARTVTLDHEDIPGLMSGMTMTFSVAPGVGLDDIVPGTEVEFRVRHEQGAYTVTEIRRSGS